MIVLRTVVTWLDKFTYVYVNFTLSFITEIVQCITPWIRNRAEWFRTSKTNSLTN